MQNKIIKRQPVEPEKLPDGAIVDGNGVVIGISSAHKLSTKEPEPESGEIVYEIYEAFQGWKKMRLEPEIPKYHVMCTFKKIGGDKDDVGLIMIKGLEPPPAGTRFVVRMLPPVGTVQVPAKSAATLEAENPEVAAIVSPEDKYRDPNAGRGGAPFDG